MLVAKCITVHETIEDMDQKIDTLEHPEEISIGGVGNKLSCL